MRPLEVVILVLDFVAIIALIVPSLFQARGFRFLPGVIVLVTLGHLYVEHYRWQMVPAYLLTVLLFLISLRRLLKTNADTPRNSIGRIMFGGFALLWLLVASSLPIILPVPRLPTPPGPLPIGSVVYAWTDSARAEIYSGNTADKRQVVVQIWYPAAPAPNRQTGKLFDRLDVAAPALAKFLGLPAFTLEHLDLVTTHTYPDAPLAQPQAPYPIVIFSSGYQGFREANYNLMEALASSGYVAVAIDHPYLYLFTTFPDGRVALNDPAILPERTQADEYKRASQTVEAVYVADERFVMDQLERLNSGALDARFAGRLDLQRIGLLGHSTGGGAIVWACSLDPRCKAGLAMDAWGEPLPASVVNKPLTQPFLFMHSEHTTILIPQLNDPPLETIYQALGQYGYRMTILGTMHDDFSVSPLLTPVSALMKERGPLPGDRTVQIVSDYTLAFFNQSLKGQASPLLNGPSPNYSEVQFESRAQVK